MEIVQSILTQNPCFKRGRHITVRGLMLHSVGCPQPDAETFVKKWNNPESSRACVHAFIDGNTGKVYQTLPWEHRAWHCGGSGNNTHIGVEMCEPACIRYTGGASFICSDREAAMTVVRRTYDTAVELFAFLCSQYGLNPLEDGVIVSHKEGHDRGIASGHGDPDHLWKGLDTEYSMAGFRRDVAAALGQAAPTRTETVSGRAASVALPLAQPVQPDAPPDAPQPVQAGGPLPVPPDAPQPVQPGGPLPVPPDASTAMQGAMSVSDSGVELVAKFEGCRLEAYKCPAGVWTIGYGHTAGVKEGDRLPSKERAKELLREDLAKYAANVNSCVKKGLITFALSQNQFDALTSFCYNCGAGNLQKLVSGRDAAAVAEKIPAYNKGGGKVLPGLVRRREEERALFLS